MTMTTSSYLGGPKRGAHRFQCYSCPFEGTFGVDASEMRLNSGIDGPFNVKTLAWTLEFEARTKESVA